MNTYMVGHDYSRKTEKELSDYHESVLQRLLQNQNDSCNNVAKIKTEKFDNLTDHKHLQDVKHRIINPIFEEHLLNQLKSKYNGSLINPCQWEDVLYPYITKHEHFVALMNMEFRESDIIIATYPRSGTTWTAQILSLLTLLVENSTAKTTDDRKLIANISSDISERVHHLEIPLTNVEAYTYLSCDKPRLFQTHLRFDQLPKSCLEKGCKIIYVVRNPKDVCVSYYNFHKMVAYFDNFDLGFPDFVSLFLNGSVLNGSWVEHVRSYCQKPFNNMFMIHYEDMVKNLPQIIQELAEFIFEPEKLCQINFAQTIQQIFENSTFDSMKINPLVNRAWIPIFDKTKGSFMRKGIIGDWKNYFTGSDNTVFDYVMSNKLKEANVDLKLSYE